LRAPRPALIGGIAIAIAVTPVLAATALAADPTVIVRAGDTLTAISRRHGVSIDRLVRLNAIADPNRIFAGQRLRIGGHDKAAERAPKRQSSAVHIVAFGSTLSGIAGAYGVSVTSIAKANGIIDPNRIFAGQRLVIPGHQPAPSRRPPAPSRPAPPKDRAADRVHVVAAGEHLTGIAVRYGVTVSQIVAANAIADPSHILAGQRLTIPGGLASGPAKAARPSMPPSMARLVAERGAIRRVIVEEADRFGVPRALVLAVAWQESGWQQHVVSSAGAVGVMQLLPATAEWVGDAMLGRPVQIYDARSNIAAGVRLLRHYLDRYGGSRDLVLAAYYQGQTAVDRYGVYAISRPYIASIKVLERLFGS
jgi:soluble lytic murein transglycosylase-like protein